MASWKDKQLLFALVALPLIAFATSSYACQVVGHKNGEDLCATTSDATGFNNAGASPHRPRTHHPRVSAAGAAPCPSGLVWRGAAAAGDSVCVTPQERDDAQRQNANGPNNQAGGGDNGPLTCRQGYVWREAFAGDTVCVTPFERDQAKQENAGNP